MRKAFYIILFVLNVIGGILISYHGAMNLNDPEHAVEAYLTRPTQPQHDEQELRAILQFQAIALVVTGVLLAVTGIIAAAGRFQRNRWLVLPWVLSAATFTVTMGIAASRLKRFGFEVLHWTVVLPVTVVLMMLVILDVYVCNSDDPRQSRHSEEATVE